LPRIGSAVGWACAFALGMVFLVSTLLKAPDPAFFAEQVTSYKILPESLGLPSAYLLIIAEGVLAVAMILLVLPRLAISLTMFMLVVFMAATAWAWAHGNAESCGCFGRSSSGPMGVIVKDTLFLIVGALALKFLHWNPKWKKNRIVFGLLLPIMISLPFWMPKAPVDRFVTPVRPGADLSKIAADGMKVPISKGSVYLALLGNECEGCVAGLPSMNEVATTKGGPTVAAIFAGSNRARRAFALEHVPSFVVGYSPEKVLRQYYRRLPVYILLEDGIVQASWYGETPSAAEVLESRPKVAG